MTPTFHQYQKEHKGKTLFNCDDCQYGSNWRGNVKTHKESVHQENMHQCEYCEYNSKWKTAFQEHKREKHNLFERKSKYFRNGKMPVKCAICEFSATSAKIIANHRRKHRTEFDAYFKCDQCEYEAISEGGLKKHNLFTHINPNTKKTYSCNQCSYTTETNKCNLWRHRQSVHGERVKKKKEIQSYPCEECDYVAKRKEYLVRHKNSIHEQKRYPCDICDFSSTQKYYLTYHKEGVHGGVKYSCDLCSYVSSMKTYFMKHKEKIHSEKEAACDLCSFVAKNKSYLYAHKLSVHEDRRFKCDKCSYVSRFKHNLNTHQEKHRETSNEDKKSETLIEDSHYTKEYKCSKCSFQTTTNNSLTKHTQSAHAAKIEEANSVRSLQEAENQEINFLKIVEELRREYNTEI